MTSDDLNQIDELLKRRINSALGPVVKKLDALWDQTVKLTEDMTEVKETQDSHTRILDSHTTSLKRIEASTENNENDTSKLNKRVRELEDQTGVVPPPELTIAR